MIDHFVQGVLTVDDEVYLFDPDLRLANGKKIRILYADIRADAEQEGTAISELLEANQWYELLLIAQIGSGAKRKADSSPDALSGTRSEAVQVVSEGERKVSYSASVPPGTRLELVSTELQISSRVVRRNDVLQGIILDLDWDAASQHYLAIYGPKLYTRRFVLVETAIGKMVLSYKALEEQLGEEVQRLAPGGYLEWKPARLDLLAILAKREPRPGE